MHYLPTSLFAIGAFCGLALAQIPMLGITVVDNQCYFYADGVEGCDGETASFGAAAGEAYDDCTRELTNSTYSTFTSLDTNIHYLL